MMDLKLPPPWRSRARLWPLMIGVALSMLLVVPWPVLAAQSRQPFDAPSLIAAARYTQRAAHTRLQVLGDAFECPNARFVSYRRSDFEPQYVDHWYVASQIWADIVLQNALEPMSDAPDDWDAQTSRCYIQKAHLFLDRQWDYSSGGGYFPRSNATGTAVEADLRFGDDNALSGLMLADLARTTSDPLGRQQYLHEARQQAQFLMTSGLWDQEFGGGFWWNTHFGDSDEGKPAQTNALAALFFGRLYELTGDVVYRTWMLRSLLWLDTVLYDSGKRLYRWSVGYQDLAAKKGAVIHQRFVNYDQSIAIEAQLLAAKLDGDLNRLARAASVGEALQLTFWVPQYGYKLDADGAQIYVSYGAWTSLGHLALYDATHDERWLAWARDNLEALSGEIRATDGGFGTQLLHCVGSLAQYCPPGETGWIVDRIRDGAAQAWMQQLQVGLALRPGR